MKPKRKRPPSQGSFPLGREVFFASIAVMGTLDNEQWRAFVGEAVDAIGMTPFGDMGSWTWPQTDAGPNGTIMLQPITESFLALDIWPDHGAAYFHICSCRSFDPEALAPLLAKYGLALVGDTGRSSLALP